MLNHIIPPEEAQAKWLCPLARTFGQVTVTVNCRGAGCALWRWENLPAEVIKEAVQTEIKRLGGGSVKHKQAVANVMAEPEKHDVDLTPKAGWCGLGGKPEV